MEFYASQIGDMWPLQKRFGDKNLKGFICALYVSLKKTWQTHWV